MSIRHKILQAIARDPRSLTEIAEETGIERSKVQDNMTAIVKEGLGTRGHEDSILVYAITEKGRQRLGNPGSKISNKKNEQLAAHPQAQPEVAENTGSAATHGSPPLHPAEAAQPVEYTSASAQTMQDLANALDKITELKRAISALDPINNNLMKAQDKAAHQANIRVMDHGVMVATLQATLTQGIILVVSEKNIFLEDVDNREYRLEPHEYDQVLDALTLVQQRLTA